MTNKNIPSRYRLVKCPKNTEGEAFYIEETGQDAIVAIVPVCCGWEKTIAQRIVDGLNSYKPQIKRK